MIDFSSVIEPVIALVASGFLAVVGVFISRFFNMISAKFGIDIEDNMRATIETAVEGAVAFGVSRVKHELEGKTEFEVKGMIQKMVIKYMLPKVPEALENFGFIDEYGEPTYQFEEFVEGRIEKYVPWLREEVEAANPIEQPAVPA